MQANMSAKNHGVFLPDADRESATSQLVGAAFGAAGQRCMALTTAVMVGESIEWIDDVVKKAAALKASSCPQFLIVCVCVCARTQGGLRSVDRSAVIALTLARFLFTWPLSLSAMFRLALAWTRRSTLAR